ncbi:neutral/alkaline non-lysosomal ceramidase N-terminal domain-containing protein [Leptospira yasudae]|uniref:neutral/alkaline non-lysosomal ceramidase N-terminal domain-containing protein n=1 Tax=Leptospira yasudae TaxID=2202201 RepID=UPI001C4EB2F8|nr:neutral/alkaline non-lysosomal ceramidase N-terminal domain-containing protein [Leptospira yasudae]MBW0432510.1 neutral/alkaline non-lysosomal ceramidase N-terminal domain-containing protein [Leptospira yasudae]
MKKEISKIICIGLLCFVLPNCSDKRNDNESILALLNETNNSANLNNRKPADGQTLLTSTAPDVFLIGAGKADITGPFVQSSTGYNSPGDQMSGLAMRLFSRAFVIERPGGNTVAIVTNDMLHMYQSVKMGVIQKLQADGYGSVFNQENVVLFATHTHSAPSNVSWYTLFNLFNGVVGFDKVHYNIIVNGTAEAIKAAYNQRKQARIRIASGTISGAAHNRSSAAYEWNFDKSNYTKNIEDTMTLLRFEGIDGSPIGLVNWFAVHGTSLGITNRRAHGDNKGYASYLVETTMGNNFVAAFPQGPMGDSSPNQPNPTDITKPFLRPNDLDPNLDALENPIVHGTLQGNKALELYNSATNTVTGNVGYRHSHVTWNRKTAIDSSYIGSNSMPWDTTSNATTCVATIGGGFLAGDEEGAPVEFAKEGEIRNDFVLENGVWVKKKYNLSNLSGAAQILGALWPLAQLALNSTKYEECDKEKFTLLPVGEVDSFWFPNPQVPFVPVILPLQVLTIGNTAILTAPFEITTQAGRRLKARVSSTLANAGYTNVIVGAMANAYAQYLTTREEYSAQNFEGGFTAYGPWSNAAIQQEFDRIAKDIVAGRTTSPGPNPPDLSNQQFVQTWLSQNGIVNDGGDFGKVLTDANNSYNKTRDTVITKFQGTHPRVVQDKKLDGTLASFYDPSSYSYLEIQKKNGTQWTTIATDNNPYTAFDWARTGGDLSPTSEVTITWLVRNQSPGTYRIVYNGLAKQFWVFFWTYKKVTGTSKEFTLQ